MLSREVIIYRPRDISLECFFLDLGPQNRLRTIHGGGLSAGIYGTCLPTCLPACLWPIFVIPVFLPAYNGSILTSDLVISCLHGTVTMKDVSFNSIVLPAPFYLPTLIYNQPFNSHPETPSACEGVGVEVGWGWRWGGGGIPSSIILPHLTPNLTYPSSLPA